jgi:hypothetical protein
VFECNFIRCDFQGATIWLDSKKSSWDTTEILNQYMQNVEQFWPSKTLQWYYHWICQKFYVRQDGQSVEIFFPKKRLGYLSPPYEQLPEKIKEYIDTRAYE